MRARATNGTRTLAQSSDVFTVSFDPDFKRWETDVPGRATEPTTAAVYELTKDATFSQMFGLLGDPETLLWEQSQIVCFCQKHRDKLRQDGYATFFLFMVGDELFVAHVVVGAGRLWVRASRFDDGLAWVAVYQGRVVVPTDPLTL